MSNQNDIRDVISRIKESLEEERRKVVDLGALVKTKIERDVGLWEYSFDELESELFRRFTHLEQKQDCLLFPDISSPRKGVGWLITLFKKAVMKVTHPYARLILERQDQYNRELIPILLSTILCLQKIKDRLNAAEGEIQELLEMHRELSKEIYTSAQNKERVERT